MKTFSASFKVSCIYCIDDRQLQIFNCIGQPIQPEVVVSTSLVLLSVNDFKMSMSCVPNMNDFNYKWEKKDSDLHARVTEVSSSNLVLINLQPEDSGEYRCIMSNSTGKIVSKYKQIKITGTHDTFKSNFTFV